MVHHIFRSEAGPARYFVAVFLCIPGEKQVSIFTLGLFIFNYKIFLVTAFFVPR